MPRRKREMPAEATETPKEAALPPSEGKYTPDAQTPPETPQNAKFTPVYKFAPVYTSGQIAKAARVHIDTVHSWERRGLLSPTLRRPGTNARLYDAEAMERAKQLGKIAHPGAPRTEEKRKREALADANAKRTGKRPAQPKREQPPWLKRPKTDT
jgi:hypothetical protein